MKTVYTVLPIYDTLVKQCYVRAKGGGYDQPVPVITDNTRLPSFQWLDMTDGATSVTTIELIDTVGNSKDITADFPATPLEINTYGLLAADSYFMYNGDALDNPLPYGLYYLRITTDVKPLYSEWFLVDCIEAPINTEPAKYLKIVFSHSCNLGDIVYEDDFEQVLYLESETMEPTFPYTEKGQENGYGQFVPTWQRQDKIYIIRTKLISQFLVDVLHRLKLHDTITLTDTVGDVFTVEEIEVEHEWQFSDKYYALATITVNLGEGIIITGCCTAINECN